MTLIRECPICSGNYIGCCDVDKGLNIGLHFDKLTASSIDGRSQVQGQFWIELIIWQQERSTIIKSPPGRDRIYGERL